MLARVHAFVVAGVALLATAATAGAAPKVTGPVSGAATDPAGDATAAGGFQDLVDITAVHVAFVPATGTLTFTVTTALPYRPVNSKTAPPAIRLAASAGRVQLYDGPQCSLTVPPSLRLHVEWEPTDTPGVQVIAANGGQIELQDTFEEDITGTVTQSADQRLTTIAVSDPALAGANVVCGLASTVTDDVRSAPFVVPVTSDEARGIVRAVLNHRGLPDEFRGTGRISCRAQTQMRQLCSFTARAGRSRISGSGWAARLASDADDRPRYRLTGHWTGECGTARCRRTFRLTTTNHSHLRRP